MKESNISNKTLITDSLIIRKLVLSNDTISGFSEWIGNIDKKSDSKYFAYLRNRFDTCFMNHYNSKYYLIDSIKVNDYIGYIIMSNFKLFMNDNFDRTLYLSLFNKNDKCIKTYIIAEGVDSGDGLIGGNIRITSDLTKDNILTTYYFHHSFLDIGPHIKEDSIITKYDLNKFAILNIDTVKHIDKIGIY